jgi:hypothetical protein
VLVVVLLLLVVFAGRVGAPQIPHGPTPGFAREVVPGLRTILPGLLGSARPAAPGSAEAGGSGNPSPLSVGVPSSLTVGPRVAVTPSTFWSVDAQTACASCISTNHSVKGFLASTPITWVRYGQGVDECNASANLLYDPNGTSSAGCGFDLASLKTWCDSLTPHCGTVIGLPGENNNSHEDAAIAKWIVKTVGLQPNFWSIGNEPTGWTHYGIPWSSWKSSNDRSPSPLAYAFDVKAAIAAVSAVDPGAKFIGIEAACSCNSQWFQDVARIDGGSLAAVAFHNYPSSFSTTETLPQFFAPLGSSGNVTASVAAVRAAVVAGCSACRTLPIFVNEYNAGPGWAPSNFGGTYANAVFLGASVAQALAANVTQFTVYNLESESTTGYGFSLMDSHGTVGPTGVLFSGLLRHLAVGSVYSAALSAHVGNVWAVVTSNATTRSLLVVNANLSHSVHLSIGLGTVGSWLGVAYHWSPALNQPAASSGTLLGSYTIPPEGFLLLDSLRIHFLSPTSTGSLPLPASPGTWHGAWLLGFVGIPAVLAFAPRTVASSAPRRRSGPFPARGSP